MPQNFLEEISDYFSQGLKIIPLQADKRPMRGFAWRDRAVNPPDFESFEYDKIGLVCGEKSGNVEVIDFDLKYDKTGNLFNHFMTLAGEWNVDMEGIVMQKTISGGYHFIYRCDTISGNLKLARTAKEDGKAGEVLIETRGEGGYIVIAPSEGYEFIGGGIGGLGKISEQTRAALFAIAKTFDQVKDHIDDRELKKYRDDYSDGLSPFDDWNARGDIQQLLEQNGWTLQGRHGKNEFYHRDGSENKYGATFHVEKRVFYVFTSSTAFEQDKGYGPAQVLAKLAFNDDYSAAAKWLLKNGYGKVVRRKTSDPFDNSEPVKEAEKYVDDPLKHEEQIMQWRNDELKIGISFGYSDLDDYFLYKQGNFVCINGFPSSGKTTFIMWLIYLLARQFNINVLIYSAENSTRSLKVKMAQYYAGMKIQAMPDALFKEAYEWVNAHFDFIDNEENYTAEQLLTIVEKLKKKYDLVLIDPYSAFIMGGVRYGSTGHQYHVDTAARMRSFGHRTGTSIWVNHHTDTATTRMRDKDGLPAPPRAQDTENGQLWWAKADDFLTIHRYPYDPDNWMFTELYVRKIKESETGGRPTEAGNPLRFRMEIGGCSFVNELMEYPDKGLRTEKPKEKLYEQRELKNFYEVERDEEIKLPF